MNTFTDLRHAASLQGCEPLPAWAYFNPELLDLEYECALLPSWQYVCHVSEVREPGAFATLDLWKDSVLVLRGEDGVLRAFHNVCRHRGARLLDGAGQCARRVVCPYHAWSYHLDGSLAAVPAERSFAPFDKATLGLRPLELEVFCGLVFVRLSPGGPALAEVLGDLAQELAPYGIEDMVPAEQAPPPETWECNWKVALDNYLDNYHVPYGHPGLHRLMDCDLACTMNAHGVSWSRSRIRERESPVWSERMYQRLARRAFADLPEPVRDRWTFCFMPLNIGIDVYPDSMDIFQVLPRGPARTEIRQPLFVRPGAPRETRATLYLAGRVNRQVGLEDRLLCERVQAGLSSHGYAPGPLSDYEMPVQDLHERLRGLCPVLRRPECPPQGGLRALNEALLRAERSPGLLATG
jgi:phenylpropionate dioxygenase-like ring-hydroxylating dioxygenase large terminal subunit